MQDDVFEHRVTSIAATVLRFSTLPNRAVGPETRAKSVQVNAKLHGKRADTETVIRPANGFGVQLRHASACRARRGAPAAATEPATFLRWSAAGVTP